MVRDHAVIPPPLYLRLPAEPITITELRHAAGEYAANVGADRERIETFVSEAVDNAVRHAFRDRSRGEVVLRMQSTFEDELFVAVVDRGVGIRPNPDSRGLGFGLSVMAALARSLTIEHPPKGGTQVEGRFPLAPPG